MTLNKWLEQVRARIRSDYDACILVVGYTGDGKSTIIYLLSKQLDESFDSDRMALEVPEVSRVLSTCSRGQVAVVDEGVEVVSSRDHATRTTKDFGRWVDVCRGRGLILFVAMANLRWVDPRIRDDRALWVVEVRRRGLARVWERVRRSPMGTIDAASSFRPLFNIRFGPVSGPDWEKYKKRKDDRIARFLTDEPLRPRRRRRRDAEDA